jgi:UDP-GlcNAc:undecaprenyl-phosphate GlcNAc-1-phosphate transferase
MGDAGSLAIGFLLASLTISFTFETGSPSARPFLLPAAVLAVPLIDGVIVICSRLKRGVHPFTAGRDHVSHRLAEIGLSPTRTVLLLWGLQFSCGIPVMIAGDVSGDILLAVWGGAAGAAVALGWRRKIDQETP